MPSIETKAKGYLTNKSTRKQRICADVLGVSDKGGELMNKKVTGTQSGVSGEYFVAAELSRRGYLCSITLKNTKGIDILVSNESSSKLIGIQVKTNNSKREAWLLNKKAETISEENLLYIFVNLNGLGELPDFYLVSSEEVAKSVRDGHENWLSTPGKKGQARTDTPMRMFLSDGTHKNNWTLLENILS